MKATRFISLLLALAILAGAVPYSYAYCMVMKRVIDSDMQLRCGIHRGAGGGSLMRSHVSISAKPMMRLVSKSTTDSYEFRRDAGNAQAVPIPVTVELTSNQSIHLHSPYRIEVGSPPADLTIEFLNLRI